MRKKFRLKDRLTFTIDVFRLSLWLMLTCSIMPFLTYLDVVKDCILVAKIIYGVGGITFLMSEKAKHTFPFEVS